MRNKLQLLLATAALTVLIWIYADQQGYKTADLPVAVRLVTPGEIVPSIEGAPRTSPGTLTVTLTARGPNAVLRGINQGRGEAIEVGIPISDNLEAQTVRTIDIRDAVTEAARDQGLQFISVNPATINVTFDRRVSHKLDVVPDAGAFSEAVSGSLVIEPPVVTVSVLQSHLASMGDFEQRLVVPIEQELRARSRETTFEFTVPLDESRWQGVPATFTPSAIRFRGRLKQPYEPVEVKLIPLRVMLPWNWPADQYDIVWEDERDRTQSVRLQVPVGKPAALTNREVLAFVLIDEKLIPPAPTPGADGPAAAEPSPQSREVRFVFPAGFEDVKIESPPAFVRFHVVRRAQAPPAGADAEPAATDK